MIFRPPGPSLRLSFQHRRKCKGKEISSMATKFSSCEGVALARMQRPFLFWQLCKMPTL